MSAPVRIAVTGSAGYWGRAVVAALAGDERVASVAVIDVRPAPYSAEGSAKVRAVTRDVRDPRLAEDLAGCDALVHLAWRVLGVGRDANSVNVDGSRNAFIAALGAGVHTIVHASSAAAYGCTANNPVPITEDHPLRPLPPFYYPQTKVAVENILDELERNQPETRIVRLRPVTILGPGAPIGPRVFATLSNFDPLMQFVSLSDVVRATLAALLPDPGVGPRAPRGAFNLGAPDPVPSSEVAGLLGVRGVRLPYRLARAAARAGAAARFPGSLHPGWVDMGRYPIVVDCARAERELGWRPSGDCAGALRQFGRLLAERRRGRGRTDPSATDLPTPAPPRAPTAATTPPTSTTPTAPTTPTEAA